LKAGVFDSGIGGLTVLKSIYEANLFEDIVYYGDTARVPYGTKDKNTIISYSLEALEFFKNFDLDILIIACNSVSAYAIEELRNNTDIPVVGVIQSGIMATQNLPKENNILVLGTKATIQSQLYKNGLEQLGFKNIHSIATPLFVPLVEENIFDGAILDATMEFYFQNIDNIDTVILGCTHFPLIQKQISNFFNDATTIHSGDAIVQYLQQQYNLNQKYQNKAKLTFFASSNPEYLKSVAFKWLDMQDKQKEF